MTSDRAHVDRLLAHLGLEREAPSLEYLDRIIAEHQRRVPFETLTKLIDYEPGVRRGDFLPPFAEYVERIVTRGAGGLCWTLARGLRVVLDDLGFDASLMMMEPGHCCVRVELDAAYYADVGYAAPIFQAYPLFESFRLETHRETFDYRVSDEAIVVTRTPGPTKTLDPTPRTIEQLADHIARANDWSAPVSFLRRLAYARYVDGFYTSLRDGQLVRHLPDGTASDPVSDDEAPRVLADIFGADPTLYIEARTIVARHGA